MGGSSRASAFAGLASGVCAVALMAGAPSWAQTAPPSSTQPATAPPAAVAAKPAAPKAKKPAPKPKKPANDDDGEDDDATKVSSVTVTAKRPPPGSVVGDIKPELTLDSSDIQSYGVSTVTELLTEIAPQTRSDRGRTQLSPVILVNGRRISSINEVQNIPTEAILRVDILPEEVSLKYGYSADQRVVNIVLKPLFHAVTAEAVGGETARGGDPTGLGELDRVNIQDDSRVNVDLKYQAAGGLTDAQRALGETSGGAPYSYAGNVESSPPGSPLLALPGQPTIAGIPAGVTAGQKLNLSDFGAPNVTDTSADHSLMPATQSLTANAVYTHPVFWGMNATLNATLGGATSDALQGLPGVSLIVPANNPFNPLGQQVTDYRYVSGESPLRQTIDGWTGHLGMTLNKDVSDWRLSFTTAYNHGDTITNTGTGLNATGLQDLLNQGSSSTLNPFGPLPGSMLNAMPLSSARLITDGGNVQILANGPLFKLPAGALYVSAKLGDTEARADSTSNMNLLDDQVLARNDASGLLNIDVPIASKQHNVLSPLGELHFNVNSAFDYYSDFGFLPTLGFGLNWTPIPGYNLIISETHDHQAPTISQLEGPVIATPGVKVFDYTTGQTVSITQLSGGNPALVADNRQVIKVGLTLKPLPKDDFTFTANYIYSHIIDPIETFPSASAAIEAAFPSRFIRNADGDLEEEDNTALNFASQDREEIRWGINYSRPVGKQPPPPPVDRRAFRRRPGGGGQGPGAAGGLGFSSLASGGSGDSGAGGAGAGGQPGAGGPNASADGGGGPGGGPGAGPGGGGGRGGAGGGGGGFGGGGRGGGRGFGGGQQVGGRFQVALYHTIIFKDRFLVAPGGPALDLLNGAAAGGAGGQYQQEIEAQMGYTNAGFGARTSADWRSATVVDGGSLGSTGALDFSGVATVNLRLWNDFSQQPALTTKYPFLRGVRLTLNLNNLFDESIHVKDTGGATPLIYQSAYLDPTGRVISINLRKLFF